MDRHEAPRKDSDKPGKAIGIELWSGLVSALGVVLGVVLLDVPAWLCLLGGAGLYLGITCLGSNRVNKKILCRTREQAFDEMTARLTDDREKIAHTRELCLLIEDEPVRTRILTICALAEGIFDNLSQNPAERRVMGRLFLYLERTLGVVEEYSRISADPMGRRLLLKEKDEFVRLLDQAQEALTAGYKNLLNNRIVEFKTMGRVLGRMMKIAEIGK